MLFLAIPGVPTFTPESTLDSLDDYSAHLHSLNEQISILLRLKNVNFKEHFANNAFQQSVILTILSCLNFLDPTVEKREGEEWKIEYVEILEVELSSRMLKLADRFLCTTPAPLLRAADIAWWIGIFEKFHEIHRNLVLSVASTLFRVSVLMRKNLFEFLNLVEIKELKQEYVVLICVLLRAASPNADKFSSTKLCLILVAIIKVADVSILAIALRDLNMLSIWSSMDFSLMAKELIKNNIHDFSPIEMLADLIKEVGAWRMSGLGEELHKVIRIEDQLNKLQCALPKIKDRESGLKLLLKYDYDLDLLLQKEGPKNNNVDEFAKLLDDKTHVMANMEKYMASLYVYEDEYVDTFDEDGAPRKQGERDQEVDISKRKNADHMSGMEEQLIRAYIKQPHLFGRSSQIRKSKERQLLCDELKLSHEQIEGWAILLDRNVNFCSLCFFIIDLFVGSQRFCY